MKLLTVTIPCYNSQDYMAKAIESALQGGDDVEILVVDDDEHIAELISLYLVRDLKTILYLLLNNMNPNIHISFVQFIKKMVDMVLQSIRELQTLPDFILRY